MDEKGEPMRFKEEMVGHGGMGERAGRGGERAGGEIQPGNGEAQRAA